MQALARSFYAQLYASEGASDMEAILDNISEHVNADINQKLTLPFLDEEIIKALFQMGVTKSPEPDGLPALFYQRHWSLLKNEVCKVVCDFLNGTDIPKDFNDTVIVMIPKLTHRSY
jgi:hypothetical protein